MIVADSRGHGRSSWTSEPIGYDLMASDYVALLDYLKIPKAAIVGWSDGGIIGIDIAMHHPDRVTKAFRAGRKRHDRRREAEHGQGARLCGLHQAQRLGTRAPLARAPEQQGVSYLDREDVGHAAELDEGAAFRNPRADSDRDRRP